MIELIQALKKELDGNLPGEIIQLELAPTFRLNIKPGNNKTDAGVLLLLYPDANNEICIAFIKRTSYDGHHSGQISFPGGKYELCDYSFEKTALRESFEEIGVIPEEIKIIGKLTELYIPVSSFLVHPYVGYINSEPVFRIDESEVEYIIEGKLKHLVRLPIVTEVFSDDKYQFTAPCFKLNNEIIWGATSMILNEFIHLVKKTGYYK
ncbi:MAG: CoA pyrophosphatase [Bacteroidales bacterium]|nr:CoA pyrophosphatase [Bacteroidales bacterium]MBN2817464.1 CoA pyrophosphatase [Bacteroidales bacterium]